MAIEGITSAVSSQHMTATQNTVKQTVGTETKEVSVQTNHQATGSADAAVISKVGQQNGGQNPTGEESNDSQKQPTERKIKQAVSDINRKLNNNTLAEFGYHEDTNRVTIKIVDKDTKEVIKEIPPEKTLDLIAKAWELAGILVDEKR